MKVKVLGCHGSDQLIPESGAPRQCGTCGFLVNGRMLIDAGTISSRLSLAEQRGIGHVLLSHLHFDHIKGLPTLADNLVGETERAVVVAGIPEVLKGLETHIFNGDVYPDFFRLPTAQQPVLAQQPLTAGAAAVLDGIRVMPVAVNHAVPTVGFLLDDGTGTLLYSGDTFQTEELWRTARAVPALKAAFIETSFPDDEMELAKVSKHLTPRLLAEELRKLDRPDVAIYVYHMKPKFRERIIGQVNGLRLANVRVLEEGQEILI